MISPDQINAIFIFLSVTSISIKLYKWYKVEKVHYEQFRSLQIKYFVTFHLITFGLALQGPLQYPLYMSDGLSFEDINNIQIVFNLSGTIFSFFISFIINIIGHRLLTTLCQLLSAFVAILRFFGGYKRFYFAQILTGFTYSMNRVAFDDWLYREMGNLQDYKQVKYIFSENNALITLVLHILAAQIDNTLMKHLDTHTIYLITSIFFFLSACFGFIFLKSHGHFKKSNVSTLSMIKQIVNNGSMSLYSLMAIDLLFMLQPLIYFPRIANIFIVKDVKYPLPSLISIYMICVLFGTMSISYLANSIRNEIILFVAFFFMAFDLCSIRLFYDNKTICFVLVCISAILDGIVTPILNDHRKNVYPNSLRATIMGFCKLCSCLFASTFLFELKKWDPSNVLFFDGICILICAIFALVYSIVHKNNEPNRPQSLEKN